jgi:hypothetical protein
LGTKRAFVPKRGWLEQRLARRPEHEAYLREREGALVLTIGATDDGEPLARDLVDAFAVMALSCLAAGVLRAAAGLPLPGNRSVH